MKKAAIIGLLMIGFIFQNCKNNKTQKDVLIHDDTETVVQQELDTSEVFENPETDKEVSASIGIKDLTETAVESPKNTSKEVIKSMDGGITSIKKEETIHKEIVVEEVSEVTKTEKEIVKEEETKTATEPIVEKVIEKETETKNVSGVEKPKTAASSQWEVPAKYQLLENPIAPTVDIAMGKSFYSKHCKSCHGSNGYGDGPKAAEMNGDLGDFSSEDFQTQSDGALFYKTSFGKDDMPRFSKKMPDDEDRWLIVNYLRTLAE